MIYAEEELIQSLFLYLYIYLNNIMNKIQNINDIVYCSLEDSSITELLSREIVEME